MLTSSFSFAGHSPVNGCWGAPKGDTVEVDVVAFCLSSFFPIHFSSPRFCRRVLLKDLSRAFVLSHFWIGMFFHPQHLPSPHYLRADGFLIWFGGDKISFEHNANGSDPSPKHQQLNILFSTSDITACARSDNSIPVQGNKDGKVLRNMMLNIFSLHLDGALKTTLCRWRKGKRGRKNSFYKDSFSSFPRVSREHYF